MNTSPNHTANRQQGFTLLELLVGMIVAVLLTGVIMGFVVTQLRNSTIATAKQQLLQQAELGLDSVTKDIRLSANADANNRWPDTYAPDPNNQYSWASSSSVLILASQAQDSSGNILFQDPNRYITAKDNHIYFVQNGTLYRRTLASTMTGNAAKTTCPAADASSSCPADRDVLDNVTAFSVSYRDASNQSVTPTNARSIIVSVTLGTTKYGESISASYSEQMVFRNDS
ncbi:MAG TPA: type II secretion system protein [Candidatus Saccharimonadales bacterium]|nr:type II secretion system protein [Candidatus Saccharimonadales bacterium]